MYLRRRSVCPTLNLKKCENVERLMVPKSLRRHVHHFEQNGGLRFRIFTDSGEARELLPSFFKQHIERRGITNEPSLFLDPLNQEFYEQLVFHAMPSGWLFFSCLEYLGHPLAFHFGFDYNGKVIWYKPSFDIDYRKRSPGRILIKHLIEYCTQTGKNEFDFTIGEEQFKNFYANDVSHNVSFTLFPNKKEYLKHMITRIARRTFEPVIRKATLSRSFE